MPIPDAPRSAFVHNRLLLQSTYLSYTLHTISLCAEHCKSTHHAADTRHGALAPLFIQKHQGVLESCQQGSSCYRRPTHQRPTAGQARTATRPQYTKAAVASSGKDQAESIAMVLDSPEERGQYCPPLHELSCGEGWRQI